MFGGGGVDFLNKTPPAPSKPPPPLPKTFVFIESLFSAFPVALFRSSNTSHSIDDEAILS